MSNNLTIDVTIAGETYTPRQLARFQYERALHVLHELKDLGADLRDGDHELTHVDINWLEPQRAEEISLDYRSSLGEEGALALYGEVLEDTERRWKQWLEGYEDGAVIWSQTDLSVSGVSVQEALGAIGGGEEHTQLALMPEHFIVVGDVSEGQRGMETFGMFGEPTYIRGTASEAPPAAFPFAKDPTFLKSMFGEVHLKRDDTNIHLGAFHQFRPTAEGFDMRSIFFCPAAAPQAIADGHTIHFALELTNAIKSAHAAKTTSDD